MKKVVIIGANDFQNPIILKAKEMGYETHVFAWRDGSVGERTADYFYPISIVEKEQILEQCMRIKPHAVVTIASDLANITVQYITRKMNLICNSDECIEITTNKYKMRCALRDNGIKTPYFERVSDVSDINDITRFSFPLIVKPTDRSGSRGITKVLKGEELQEAIKVSANYSFEKKAIVEEYIEGTEYSCECISFDGEHSLLAITQKFTTGAPHFIETGHVEPADLSEEYVSLIREEIFRALDVLQIRYGASHSEFRITPTGEIRIIEIGSRMGGDCIGSDLVKISTGMDFLEMVIDVACGKRPVLEKQQESKSAGIRFVFGQKDIDVLEKIRKQNPNALIFVSDIQPIGETAIVDSGTRYGYYIIACKTYDELVKLMELR